MKKLLITLFPFLVAVFTLMWISCGLKGALTFLGVMLLIVAFVFGLFKWMEFVDKHIKD